MGEEGRKGRRRGTYDGRLPPQEEHTSYRCGLCNSLENLSAFDSFCSIMFPIELVWVGTERERERDLRWMHAVRAGGRSRSRQ